MAHEKVFQIKTKEDARFLAGEIRKNNYSFYYYTPLLGISGGAMIIRCPRDQKKCTIYSTGSGWQNQEGNAIADVINYIWKERKRINAELRHPESDWFMKFKRDK